ncbi:hypothetical protein Smp_171000 [Schistosoma mansoni]|uniref:hypothetical protein n=1 Tax=Schistosoma mansoni TaxID=6183 RepID=UPI0001A61CD7|nr:hypothetical protein Smp_171000 [Schistosoma mansoni]|eukprot:XP_018649653.1 hypothetical protein Smp_171000 [Schistosoma mansoni]
MNVIEVMFFSNKSAEQEEKVTNNDPSLGKQPVVGQEDTVNAISEDNKIIQPEDDRTSTKISIPNDGSNDQETTVKMTPTEPGLFRITPRIQSKISQADKRPKLPTSCQPIQHSKSRVNLFSRILSDSNCLPSQESLQLSSIEVLNVHSENDKKCITGPINDGKLPSAETIKSEFHQHACKSTPNPPGDENSGVTTSFQIIISETMNKEVNNKLASAVKKRRRELLIAYEKAMQPITSIDVAPEYEIQLLSLFQ